MVALSTIPPHPQALGSPGASRGCSRMCSSIPGAPGLGTGNAGSRWEGDSPRQLQDFPGILWNPVNPDGLHGGLIQILEVLPWDYFSREWRGYPTREQGTCSSGNFTGFPPGSSRDNSSHPLSCPSSLFPPSRGLKFPFPAWNLSHLPVFPGATASGPSHPSPVYPRL